MRPSRVTFTHAAVAPQHMEINGRTKGKQTIIINDVSHSDCCHFNVLQSLLAGPRESKIKIKNFIYIKFLF